MKNHFDTDRILFAIGKLDTRMNRLEEGQVRLEKRLGRVEEGQQEIQEVVHGLAGHMDERFIKVESQMVTKDYLDERLGDLKGDMVALVRKGDRKANNIIGTLARKRVLTRSEANALLAESPLP